MKRLPNYEYAFIPDEKISGYCLNTNHERGSHKARVFKQVLGISSKDAELLKSTILQQLDKFEITSVKENKYGKIFSLPMKISILVKKQKL